MAGVSMVRFRSHIIVAIIALMVGAYASYKLQHPPVEVQYKERVVEKLVEKRNIVTRTVRMPNGTVTTETVDRTSLVTDTDKKVEALSIPKPPSKYSLSVRSIIPISKIDARVYEVSAGVRVAGPLWAEAGVMTDKKITLGLRWEF
jgi:hypothetical protein